MTGPKKFDVAAPKGLAGFNGFMGSKSYVEGWQYSSADDEVFAKFAGLPDADKYPHAYRWYIHIAALKGVRGLSLATSFSVPPPAAAAPTVKKKEVPVKKECAEEIGDDDDDFDVFGDDNDEEDEEPPKESRAEMLARLKREAEERTAKKEAKQRTLVAIEIKPWDVEQDLMALWEKITKTVTQDGLKWGESCTLAPVAFGIKKIQTTFVMGVKNSSDDIVEAIEAFEDEVQSVDITSMNVL